jgi:hypothetical protein
VLYSYNYQLLLQVDIQNNDIFLHSIKCKSVNIVNTEYISWLITLTTTSYEAVMCKIKINTIFIIIILHSLIFITKVSANNEFCYTSSGVFGIIIASVVITLVVIGLTLATLWFLWTKNRLKLGKKLNYLSYKEHNFENQ